MDTGSDLRLVDALLDAVAGAFPELAGPDDERADAVRDGAGVEEAAGSVVRETLPFAFDRLLEEELAAERDFAERGYLVDPVVHCGTAFGKDGDGNIVCRVGAIVGDHDGNSFVIELEPPVVDKIVGRDIQRPVGDKVRVCAFLVRVGCQCVGFPGDPVGFLRKAVCRLRELVAIARLEQGDDSGDASDGSDRRADGRNDVPNIRHGNQSTSNPACAGVVAVEVVPDFGRLKRFLRDMEELVDRCIADQDGKKECEFKETGFITF